MGVSRPTVAVLLVVVVVVAAAAGYLVYTGQHGKTTSPLIIYTADAYVAESQYLYSGFANSSGISYAPPKSGGSFVLARQIAEGEPSSVFISVAKSAVTSSYLGNESSGWAIGFATDQLVLAYSGSPPEGIMSLYQAAASTQSNTSWYNFFQALTSGSYKVGISDPNSDPAGLRAWLALEAAGRLYANGNQSYFVERMLIDHGNVTAPSAAELFAPLEAGQIQFLFVYKSAVISHSLQMMTLPPYLNQGDPALASFYSSLTYDTSSGVQAGSPIILYITVPKDSTDPATSYAFVAWVVKHATTLSMFGLEPLSPPVLYNDSSVPQQLTQLLQGGFLVNGGTL